jgi:hypothetical protein
MNEKKEERKNKEKQGSGLSNERRLGSFKL